MIIAEDIVEEYMEHYKCNKVKAIKMAIEDLDLAKAELVEELLKEKI